MGCYSILKETSMEDRKGDHVAFRRKRFTRNWSIFTDGAIRPQQGVSGLSVVVYDESQRIALWWYRWAEKMTCNEAEYAAVIFAFEQLLPFRPLVIDLYSDSQVLVRQMSGEAATRSPALIQKQHLLRRWLAEYERVSFHHVAREENRVADALANEAIVRYLQERGGKETLCATNLPVEHLTSGR